MNIKSLLETDIPEIEVSGEIDHFFAPEFEQHIVNAINKRPQESLIIDFSRLDYLDSAAIGVLFATLDMLKKRSPGKKIILICPNPNVRKIIELVGIQSDPAFMILGQREEKVIKEAK